MVFPRGNVLQSPGQVNTTLGEDVPIAPMATSFTRRLSGVEDAETNAALLGARNQLVLGH